MRQCVMAVECGASWSWPKIRRKVRNGLSENDLLGRLLLYGEEKAANLMPGCQRGKECSQASGRWKKNKIKYD